jgi:hypothetical protein
MSLKDTSQADICNEEEYNKIFHPKNEIKRSKFLIEYKIRNKILIF